MPNVLAAPAPAANPSLYEHALQIWARAPPPEPAPLASSLSTSALEKNLQRLVATGLLCCGAFSVVILSLR